MCPRMDCPFPEGSKCNPGLSILALCVQEKFSLTAHWHLQFILLYILGRGGNGVSDFVSSLDQWCTATTPVGRLWLNPCSELHHPFSILYGAQWGCVVAGRQCSVTARGELAVPRYIVEVGTYRSWTYSPWDISSKGRRISEKVSGWYIRGRLVMASRQAQWQVVYGFGNEKTDEKEKAKPCHFYMTGGDISPKCADSTLRIRNFDRTKTRIEKCDNIFLMMSTLLAPLLAKHQHIIRRILNCL